MNWEFLKSGIARRIGNEIFDKKWHIKIRNSDGTKSTKALNDFLPEHSLKSEIRSGF
jgi:hypothetical protein